VNGSTTEALGERHAECGRGVRGATASVGVQVSELDRDRRRASARFDLHSHTQIAIVMQLHGSPPRYGDDWSVVGRRHPGRVRPRACCA
jgi:hypothetical protein